MLKDYYSILGISFNASDDEIKRAYRALSKRWHPDVNPGLDTTAIMQDINEAYFILRDSAMRVRYDAEYVKKLIERYEELNQVHLPIVLVVSRADEVSPGRYKNPKEYPENKIDTIDKIPISHST